MTFSKKIFLIQKYNLEGFQGTEVPDLPDHLN